MGQFTGVSLTLGPTFPKCFYFQWHRRFWLNLLTFRGGDHASATPLESDKLATRETKAKTKSRYRNKFKTEWSAELTSRVSYTTSAFNTCRLASLGSRYRPRNIYLLPHIQGGWSTTLCLLLFGTSVTVTVGFDSTYISHTSHSGRISKMLMVTWLQSSPSHSHVALHVVIPSDWPTSPQSHVRYTPLNSHPGFFFHRIDTSKSGKEHSRWRPTIVTANNLLFMSGTRLLMTIPGDQHLLRGRGNQRPESPWNVYMSVSARDKQVSLLSSLKRPNISGLIGGSNCGRLATTTQITQRESSGRYTVRCNLADIVVRVSSYNDTEPWAWHA